MTFRENLLKKIKIDKISEQVIASIGTPDSGKKIDGEAMRDLLEIKPYKLKRERDLDLFILEKDKGFWSWTMIWQSMTPLLKMWQ